MRHAPLAELIDPEEIEGVLSFARISELDDDPVDGAFDRAHLTEMHRRIFQDLPGHRPGLIRPPSAFHVKYRELIAEPFAYRVYYADREGTPDRGGFGPLEARLDRVLGELGGPGGVAALRELDDTGFAARLATLYAELDFIHPFDEGNSRTLRTFTSQIAQAAGRALRWIPERVRTPHEMAVWRDHLYLARDRACANRAVQEDPGPMQKTAAAAIARIAGDIHLEAIMREVVQPQRGLRQVASQADHGAAVAESHQAVSPNAQRPERASMHG